MEDASVLEERETARRGAPPEASARTGTRRPAGARPVEGTGAAGGGVLRPDPRAPVRDGDHSTMG